MLAVVDAAKRELAVGDRLRRGGLERDANEVRANGAGGERSVDDGGNLATRRRRAFSQVDGADTEDAVIARESGGPAGNANTLILDDEAANGHGVRVLLPREAARAVGDRL